MFELEKLFQRIVQRVNINLRELEFDISPFVSGHIQMEKMKKFYAFYGITPDHPLNLTFRHSGLAGSYFLGNCRVVDSLLYKSDIRGDELKRQGKRFRYKDFEITLNQDEVMDIQDSALVKTLVHNYSHDPETPERFFIKDTLALHYANIHGSPSVGCFLGPFATVDLTTMRDCVIGTFSYIQAGEISHLKIKPGTIWVNSPGQFNFLYRYPAERLKHYIWFTPGGTPQGLIFDFIEERKEAFQRIFDSVILEDMENVPGTASLDRYAVVLPSTTISENVLVSQRAYLENSYLGKGANAQENCMIINSRLEGCNVTAHGAKIINADLGTDVFVGFNSFIYGKQDSRLSIGKGCVIMPHTIIDCEQPLSIPAGHLVWGLVTSQEELETNSIPLDSLRAATSGLHHGDLHFEGNGAAFVQAFADRIHHILDVNGAFYDGRDNRGHAQKNQKLSLNTIQPFQFGDMQGMYPSMTIKP